MGGNGAGDDRSVGRCPLDAPEPVGVGIGAACDPFDGAVDAGHGGGGGLRIQQCAVGGVEDRVHVVVGVRVDIHDKWVAMRGDIQGGSPCSSSCDGQGSGGRHRPARVRVRVTMEQHYGESRPRGWTIS